MKSKFCKVTAALLGILCSLSYASTMETSVYHFDNPSPLVDSGSLGENLSLSDASTQQVAGYIGQAYAFSSTATTDKNVYVTNWNNNPNTYGYLGINLWFKADATQSNSYPTLIERNGFKISFQNSKTLTFTVTGLSTKNFAVVNPQAVLSTSLYDGQWHSVEAFVDFDGHIASITVDDVTATKNLTYTSGAIAYNYEMVFNADQTLSIGGLSTAETRGFNGAIDELYITLPEPMTLSILVFGGMLVCVRRKKR